MSRMRLLSINNYHYRRGGAEVVYLEHNRLLEGAGWDVDVFAMKHPRNLAAATADRFVDEIELGGTYGTAGKIARAGKIVYSLEARRKIGNLISAKRPAIAHAHNIYHHISPSIFPEIKAAGIPLVMTVHDLKIACPAYTMRSAGGVCERCKGGRIHNVVVNRCIKGSLAMSALVMLETAVHRALGLYRRNVDAFVVPSRFFVDKLVEWGWPRESFRHIPNFVDVAAFEPQGTPGRAFLYFGRLAPEKGVDVLIAAAAEARVPLAIAGAGPEEERLKALAGRLGGEVQFIGYRTGRELFRAVSAARAVVLPSIWYENAPMTILESYALARPVVGTAIGGIPELIRDGETGAIVAPSDVQQLAAALRRIADLPDAAVATMGEEGRLWVAREFSSQRYLDRTLDLYRSLGANR